MMLDYIMLCYDMLCYVIAYYMVLYSPPGAAPEPAGQDRGATEPPAGARRQGALGRAGPFPNK